MNTEILSLKHVAAGYGSREVLTDVTLSVREGEFAGLIGSNGAGKSTLIKCVFGLIPLRRGALSICGRENAALKSR